MPCALAALLWHAVAMAASSAHAATVITDVTIVDVVAGQNVGPRTVLIEDGRIVSIDAPGAVHAPASAQHVDGRGRFLIPGLTDMHVHLFNLSSHRAPNDWSFPLYVANGITGIRDMRADAASIQQVKQWRAAMESGQLIAPRVLASGIAVYGTSPADAAADVDAAAAAGTDFIKVFSDVPAANWRAILAQAKLRSLPVVGHVPAGVELLEAAKRGQRTSEHLTQVYEACSSSEARILGDRQGLNGEALMSRVDSQEAQVLATFDPAVCRHAAKALAATGQVQVPTLALADEDTFAQNAQREHDDRWQLLRPDEQLRWQRFVAGYTKDDPELASRRWPIARSIVSILHQAGVPIMAGTDSPMPGVYPGFALQDELQLLVESGLSPMDALRAATLEPARFLHIDDVSGSVAVGKQADLVLLDADPTRDIRNAQRIRAVLLAGRLLTRGDLDALLSDATRAQHPARHP
ncbi:amidohydrolase family protein [Dyella sp. C11]|uniref:amidohydrolase family protein n=1 Tax=Dyella sp. C11 TaxID=2126991 RepID=UPI0013006BF8|nr:amidohydrolase family protein [Dyella sp. C11]